MSKRYLSANVYCRRVFGCKTYKLALSAATSCPNRDGVAGVGGCTFCSAGGSGDFAASAALPIPQQLAAAKRLLGQKGEGLRYIAYFQSYTGTYGDLSRLEQLYTEAAGQPDIVGLSIATRPDCLGADALAMLERLSRIKPLWVELGLQTMHADTARRIHRGYELPVYEKALDSLAALGVHRITHLIFGLPGETREQMLQTVRYAGERTDGVKLQLLHVLAHTALAESWQRGELEMLTPQAY